jgi:carbon starvation protein CstA
LVKLGTLAVIVWLLIGVIAADQRHDFNALPLSCKSTADITMTVVAGALNYLGVDPQVNCHVPKPSS